MKNEDINKKTNSKKHNEPNKLEISKSQTSKLDTKARPALSNVNIESVRII